MTSDLALLCHCCGTSIPPDNPAHRGILGVRLNTATAALLAERGHLETLRRLALKRTTAEMQERLTAQSEAVAKREREVADLRRIEAACYGGAGR
jgi:hypothetical protein